MRCSFDVYSKPHACYNTQTTLQTSTSNPHPSYLQLRDHRLFVVVGRAQLSDQSLRQHLSVELLEHVFVFDIVEHHLTVGTRVRVRCMSSDGGSHHDLIELLFEIGLFDGFASGGRKKGGGGEGCEGEERTLF